MKETVHFSIHGDFITEKIRDLVEEGNIHKAWNIFETITDNKEIFKNFIKGTQAFTGVDELTLLDVNDTDIGLIAMGRMIRKNNKLKDELDFLEKNYNDPEKFDIGFSDLIAYKNTLDNELMDSQSEINRHKAILEYSEDDMSLSLLYKYKSDSLDSKYGWITEKGWFLPVNFAEHDKLVYEYFDEAKLALSVENVEKRWIRITQSMDTIAISMYNFVPKARQEIMLIKWVNHHKLIPNEGDSLMVLHFGGELVRSNGKVKLIRFKD